MSNLIAPTQGKESPPPAIVLPEEDPPTGRAWQFAAGEFSEIDDPLPAPAADEDLAGVFDDLGFSGAHFLDVAVGYSVSKSIEFGVPASADEEDSVSIYVGERETPTTSRWSWCLVYADAEGVGITVWAARNSDFRRLLQEVVRRVRRPRRGGSR